MLRNGFFQQLQSGGRGIRFPIGHAQHALFDGHHGEARIGAESGAAGGLVYAFHQAMRISVRVAGHHQHGVIAVQDVQQPVVVVAAGKLRPRQRMVEENKHRSLGADFRQVLLEPEQLFFTDGRAGILQGGRHQANEVAGMTVERIASGQSGVTQRLQIGPPGIIVVPQLWKHRDGDSLPISLVFLPPAAATAELIQVAGRQHKAGLWNLEAVRGQVNRPQTDDLGDRRLALSHRRMQIARMDERKVSDRPAAGGKDK